MAHPSFVLQSPDFEPGGPIPRRCTCEGADVAPALQWSPPPPGTRSLALIVDDPDAPDPDAPRTVWVHWVLYNLPAETTALRAGTLPDGTHQGLNDWKSSGYRGPCPPIGRHRYFFKLYALDVALPLREGATKAQVEHAMKGHVLAEAQVIGTYRKGHGRDDP